MYHDKFLYKLHDKMHYMYACILDNKHGNRFYCIRRHIRNCIPWELFLPPSQWRVCRPIR